MNRIEKYLDFMIKNSTPDNLLWDKEKIQFNKPQRWNYVNGCMMKSIIDLYEITNKKKYLKFVDKYLEYFINCDGSINFYNPEKYSLDDICSSQILFKMYDYTKKEKYLLAIKQTYKQIENQPKTLEGNFWHKLIYPNQVWLDGFYMVMPFYIQYKNMFLNKDYKDIISMYNVAFNNMFDENKELYYHGYDASKTIFWADKETGLSKSFWLRANGWFLVSMVDVYEYIYNDDDKMFIKNLVTKSIKGILKYLDKNSYMFYQVIDRIDSNGNYLETSGSSMVAYTILKACRLGIIDKEYYEIGKKIFKGICKKNLKVNDDKIELDGICLVAGLGPEEKPRRDGTYEYYISEPVVKNEAKGIAPFIMAYIELKRGRYENRN